MYTIAIKIEGFERRKRSTGILHLAAGFFLLAKTMDYFKLSGYAYFINVLPFLAVVLLCLAYGFFKRKMDAGGRFNHWVRTIEVLAFAVLGILMINKGRPIDYLILFTWAIICLFLMFTERKMFHDAKMFFKKDGIFIPGYFYNQKLFWDNIKEIVARKDFITIFYPNNKFLQYEVMSLIDEEELAEINSFCKYQIDQFSTESNH
jgi:hypothetical protein